MPGAVVLRPAERQETAKRGGRGGRRPVAASRRKDRISAPFGVSRAEERTPPMARFPDSRIAARSPRLPGDSSPVTVANAASRLQWRDRVGFSPTSRGRRGERQIVCPPDRAEYTQGCRQSRFFRVTLPLFGRGHAFTAQPQRGAHEQEFDRHRSREACRGCGFRDGRRPDDSWRNLRRPDRSAHRARRSHRTA